MSSCLYAVGVGPGDPELLTLKGARLIREADVVITPVGDRSDASIARSIVEAFVDPNRQQWLTQVFPMRHAPADLQGAWARSAEEVAALVRQGKTVVFVTLGDPVLYSTFLYLDRELKAHFPDIPVKIVPGVSSVHAAGAAAGIPLAMGDERLAVLPATYEEEELVRALQAFDTVILLKVHRVFDRVRDLLHSMGLKDRAVYIKRVGLPEAAVFHDLDAVGAGDLDYLSLVIVKK